MEKPRRSEMEDENEDGIGRSYECNYCKRGFTNAQALGGHMNIHRKDKAKAKPKTKQYKNPNPNPNTFSSSYSSSSTNYYSPTYLAPPHRNNYYNYPQFANCSPRSPLLSSSQPSIYFGNESFSVGRPSRFDMYEEPLGANLSLRMEESNKRKEDDQNNNYGTIDLELRLGYDP